MENQLAPHIYNMEELINGRFERRNNWLQSKS